MIMEGVNFGEVVNYLNKGKIAYRQGSLYVIYQQIGSVIGKDYVPKMTSLPPSVKEKIKDLELNSIEYHNQWCKMFPNGKITTYIPSIEDINALDWIIELD